MIFSAALTPHFPHPSTNRCEGPSPRNATLKKYINARAQKHPSSKKGRQRVRSGHWLCFVLSMVVDAVVIVVVFGQFLSCYTVKGFEDGDSHLVSVRTCLPVVFRFRCNARKSVSVRLPRQVRNHAMRTIKQTINTTAVCLQGESKAGTAPASGGCTVRRSSLCCDGRKQKWTQTCITSCQCNPDHPPKNDRYCRILKRLHSANFRYIIMEVCRYRARQKHPPKMANPSARRDSPLRFIQRKTSKKRTPQHTQNTHDTK